uniref:Dephospho-CoA kinase n=1 Tax=Candidatus Kentrum sp. FW TaxID=2126338 RepID=A0A450RW11_9GAMM|nr:MAG: dephospho-CoA kinase [Candidatus Kentron sp. FW]
MNFSRFIVGLTGGIASGKTTVARILAEQGVPIIDADEVARDLVEPGQSALEEIVSAFGADILDTTGRLDRAALRAQVFSVPADRERIEGILHPRIRQEMRRRSDIAVGPYCVLAIPLLLETSQKMLAGAIPDGSGNSQQEELHRVWRRGWGISRVLVIDTPVEQQIERACERDGTSVDAVKAIILAQASQEERLAVAHDVIVNDGNLEHLRRQTMVLHHRYLHS